MSYLYNRLDELNPMCPIGEQLLNLGEDLFQAQFEDGTVVDVGFYPWSSDGAFKVSVIKDGNWDEPVKQYECKELKELYTRLGVTLVEVSTCLKKKDID
ncbi:hypothetical protein [Pseudoduganella armeniaca]|uniref:hypothetical protein n=1 Tax=Pseudoduganella armeniaca TaxID=2072590 RepID=UPI0011B1F971|nr:hypothetical protein [Pseudoduganella armeniaca]